MIRYNPTPDEQCRIAAKSNINLKHCILDNWDQQVHIHAHSAHIAVINHERPVSPPLNARNANRRIIGKLSITINSIVVCRSRSTSGIMYPRRELWSNYVTMRVCVRELAQSVHADNAENEQRTWESDCLFNLTLIHTAMLRYYWFYDDDADDDRAKNNGDIAPSGSLHLHACYRLISGVICVVSVWDRVIRVLCMRGRKHCLHKFDVTFAKVAVMIVVIVEIECSCLESVHVLFAVYVCESP